MKIKMVVLSAVLTALPALAIAEGCSRGHQVMSCAEGEVFDASSGKCVVKSIS